MTRHKRQLLSLATIALLVGMICVFVGNSIVFADSEEANQPIAIDTETLDSYIQKEFEKTHIPAMSVEIVDADGIVLADSYGEGGDLDTPYILGSISKSFTSVAIMQLVEQGKVDTSKPIADYLPDVDRDCKTTVKQLLNQSSHSCCS